MSTKLFLVVGATLILSGLSVLVVNGSSHREAPMISADPPADATDLYMYRDPEESSKVNIIMKYYPFQEPSWGPNFYRFDDEVMYSLHNRQ